MPNNKNTWVDNPAAVTFTVDRESRTIKGLALPFGDIGNGWTFTKGTLTWTGRVKVLDSHDYRRAFATAALVEKDDGIHFEAKVPRGAIGDQMLALAEPDPDTGEAVYDGLSIGLAPGVGYEIDDNGIYHGKSGHISEVSLTPFPAFENAKVTSVAASAVLNPEKETIMEKEENGSTVKVEDVDSRVAVLEKKFDKLDELKAPLPPAGAPRFQVKEEPLYRFDGTKAASGKDFSTDLVAGLGGDHEAMARLMGFMNESMVNPTGLNFVDTDDVEHVNPSRYRQDLFQDEEPEQPAVMYNTFYAGGLSDVTPFFYSKMGEYAGLIGTHTEGTPPTAGSFETETGATITPSAISGRIFLTREVVDQGGNPNVSGLIWSKFQRVFRQTLEQRAAAVLHANLAGFTALATPTTGATGKAIGASLKQGLVNLQFTANGQRFRKFFAAKDLYSALAAAEDDNGRPLYPILAAQNADGTSANRLGNINVAGINLEPTWSTEIKYGSAPGEADDTSFYVDPGAIKVWNSGLTKIDRVGETAAGWNIDVFAYVATHLYDATGIRKVTYKASA